jgi:hypothetical protein
MPALSPSYSMIWIRARKQVPRQVLYCAARFGSPEKKQKQPRRMKPSQAAGSQHSHSLSCWMGTTNVTRQCQGISSSRRRLQIPYPDLFHIPPSPPPRAPPRPEKVKVKGGWRERGEDSARVRVSTRLGACSHCRRRDGILLYLILDSQVLPESKWGLVIRGGVRELRVCQCSVF